MVIAVDFDHTIAYSDFPKIIGEVEYAGVVIALLRNRGHRVILNTCRTGRELDKAIQWMSDKGIVVDKVNENMDYRTERFGSDSRKISCDINIDDKNLFADIRWPTIFKQIKRKEVPVIIAIVGESGTGKTTFADLLYKKFGIKTIQSYTDRPKRCKGEKGHKFLSKRQFDRLRKEDMIAYTNWSDKRYCCLKKDVKDLNTYVIDEYGLNMLKQDHWDRYDIWSVRLKRPYKFRNLDVDPDRIQRDKNRFVMPEDSFDVVYENLTNDMSYWHNAATDLIVNKIRLLHRVKKVNV